MYKQIKARTQRVSRNMKKREETRNVNKRKWLERERSKRLSEKKIVKDKGKRKIQQKLKDNISRRLCFYFARSALESALTTPSHSDFGSILLLSLSFVHKHTYIQHTKFCAYFLIYVYTKKHASISNRVHSGYCYFCCCLMCKEHTHSNIIPYHHIKKHKMQQKHWIKTTSTLPLHPTSTLFLRHTKTLDITNPGEHIRTTMMLFFLYYTRHTQRTKNETTMILYMIYAFRSFIAFSTANDCFL